jgi:hypothetical protein
MSWTKEFRSSLGVAIFTTTTIMATSGWAAPIVVVEDYSIRGPSNDAGINFALDYGANTPAGATWTDNPSVPYGSARGLYQSPFHSNELTATNSFFSVGGNIAPNDPTLPASPSPASLLWGSGQDQQSFSILWGSIDSYNVLNFRRNGSTIYSLNGAAAAGLINQTFGTSLTANSSGGFAAVALLSFSFLGLEAFDEVQFVSSSAAFEFALAPPPPISTLAVPAPSAIVLVLGFLLLSAGLSVRSQHRRTVRQGGMVV